jgi:hypothetical protein
VTKPMMTAAMPASWKGVVGSHGEHKRERGATRFQSIVIAVEEMFVDGRLRLSLLLCLRRAVAEIGGMGGKGGLRGQTKRAWLG